MLRLKKITHKAQKTGATSQETSCTMLSSVKKGERFVIKKILDPKIKCMSLRFGVSEGEEMLCLSRSNGGPVILQKKHQEIAIGHSLTGSIQVEKVS